MASPTLSSTSNKRSLQTYGIERLLGLPPVHESRPMGTLEEVQEEIVGLILAPPAWGCNRVTDQLKLKDASVKRSHRPKRPQSE